jgi:predicted small lipoprotein YifL
MKLTGLRLTALLACLLLMLSACGNKGPLYLPEDEETRKTKTAAE